MDALVRSRNRNHHGLVDQYPNESEQTLVAPLEPSRVLLSGAEH